MALNVLLLAGLFYTLARPLPLPDAVTGQLQPSDAGGDLTAVTGGTVSMARPAPEDYDALAAGDLFGVIDSGIEPEPDAGVQEEEYELPVMHLAGTIAGSGSVARALIRVEEQGAGQRLFRVGDKVAGLTVERIDPRSVTLSRDGSLYELGMDFSGALIEIGDTGPQSEREVEADRVVVVGSGGEVAASGPVRGSEPSARERRGRWSEMDEEERQRRLDAMRERRERMLQDADPETRERILERIRRAEEMMQERRDAGERPDRRR